jgi:hypothetical protein
VNVEPHKKIDFKLTYEELLSRRLGTYRHVVNLDPGQIVRDLRVTTRITESSNITSLRVPALRTSNEISDDPSGEHAQKLNHSVSESETDSFQESEYRRFACGHS